ncbi:MAG: peptide ABC transporter substrate-binding protein, partial [Coxiella sp. (in: Bacteria)]
MDYHKNGLKYISCISLLALSVGSFATAWNNPNSTPKSGSTRYSAFTGPPKTLDPARSYSSDEAVFTAQIYEPPLQYHLLKRPYALVPLTLTDLPTVTFYNKKNQKLPAKTPPNDVAYTVYDLYLKPGIMYQPHPAFVQQSQDLTDIHKLTDFKKTGSRELTAHDYVYQIKRLASPRTQSPILSLMAKHIVGLDDYSKLLSVENGNLPKGAWLDLRKHPIEGVKAISPYHYQIKIKGVYPQFKYWLAMPFFAPIPWEADQFYSRPGMKARNITFDWQPIGTGAYMLSKNDPNKEMILERNPNYHVELYPHKGEAGDQQHGYLVHSGKTLPLTDRYVFSLDKENIPRWNKFLQGYYDVSGIGADSFDQAVKIDKNGDPILTESMKKQGIKLDVQVSPGIFYTGFNMLDKIVGGHSEKQRK